MGTFLFVAFLVVVAFGIYFGVSRITESALGARHQAAMPAPQASKKPPLPEEQAAEFLAWYNAQTKPAIALTPDPESPIDPKGTRLFGPAYLEKGEEWPCGNDGRTLDFLAQLNLEDCAALEGYPQEGIVQFFVGRDDLFGANFDDLLNGQFHVRCIPADMDGEMRNPPHSDEFDTSGIDDFSPSCNHEARLRGIRLAAAPVEDRIDLSVMQAEERFFALSDDYDLDPLYDRIDAADQNRPARHHTGGFPAFVQSDIRKDPRYADFDRVILRLTSDDFLMWGDVGEAVFMMRSSDLAAGNFSQVAYSWDCS